MKNINTPALQVNNEKGSGVLPALVNKLFLIVGLLLIFSCVDPIQLDIEGKSEFIVITGQITNVEEPYTVSVFNSAKFLVNEYALREPIRNADVSIISDTGESVKLKETESGIYKTESGELVGCIGKNYLVSVKLMDGKEYSSVAEAMLPVPSIEHVSFAYAVDQELNESGNIVSSASVKVFVDTQIPEDKKNLFLKWDVLGEYQFNEWKPPAPGAINEICYAKDVLSAGEVHILNASLADGIVEHKEIKSIVVSYKFAANYCLHIRQQSLSEGAYNFWKQVSNVTEREGGLFEQPAGKVVGNIQNVNDPNEEVLGYFYVSALDIGKVFVPTEDVNNPKFPCPTNEEFLVEACLNCRTIRNSTYQKPSYWP